MLLFLLILFWCETKWGTQGIIGGEIDSVAGTIAEKRMEELVVNLLRPPENVTSENCDMSSGKNKWMDDRMAGNHWCVGPQWPVAFQFATLNMSFILRKLYWGERGEIAYHAFKMASATAIQVSTLSIKTASIFSGRYLWVLVFNSSA